VAGVLVMPVSGVRRLLAVCGAVRVGVLECHP
jgi:hypothetical protein